jgi:hypothetical protein
VQLMCYVFLEVLWPVSYILLNVTWDISYKYSCMYVVCVLCCSRVCTV